MGRQDAGASDVRNDPVQAVRLHHARARRGQSCLPVTKPCGHRSMFRISRLRVLRLGIAPFGPGPWRGRRAIPDVAPAYFSMWLARFCV
ncbi:MAG: hypothetical protein BWZ02_00718 [Lentisphaerae bacterium ADurb.BinA184]|nr:MAG: hypothetical protein BWZ02_00718 [Lentisphaerae bacterium ADurb.BinA184]